LIYSCLDVILNEAKRSEESPAAFGTRFFAPLRMTNIQTQKNQISINQKEKQVMGKLSILAEFWDFLKMRKKWWLLPIVFFLLLLGALIVLTEGSALAPFIYTLF